MDDADIASQREIAEIQMILHNLTQYNPLPRGKCNYCKSDCTGPFCDADCRDEYDRKEKARIRNGRG